MTFKDRPNLEPADRRTDRSITSSRSRFLAFGTCTEHPRTRLGSVSFLDAIIVVVVVVIIIIIIILQRQLISMFIINLKLKKLNNFHCDDKK